MAKRKRLGPAQDPDDILIWQPPAPASPPRRVAPIADVVSDAASAAAFTEVSETLRRARDEGRLVMPLPLAAIDPDYLVRDRVALNEPEMIALMDSLRARGQQSPIDVAALPDGRFGLISGWRRLQALVRLQLETGEDRFATVLALQRRPAQAAQAYLAMIEENEIRVGLSFYERARIGIKATEQGVYHSEKAALLDLYRTASRAKRSKIRSFCSIVRALDGHLRFPAALGERIGLVMAQGLDTDANLAPRLCQALKAQNPTTAEAEQATIAKVLLEAKKEKKAALSAVSEPVSDLMVAPDLWLQRHPDGAVTLRGAKVDAAFQTRLLHWLRQPAP